MYYSAIGFIAILILVIENNDILFKRDNSSLQPAWKVYRHFLLAVLVYYATDVCWGVLESQKLTILLFIDTLIYFVAMAVGVMFWTKYTVTYLNEKSVFGQIFVWSGRVFFAVVSIEVGVNIFTPTLFWVDRDCVYHANVNRYVILVIQIILLILLSVYASSSMLKRKDASRKRYRTIAFFGLIMAIFLTIQLWFPYLPLYSIAYMLGTSLLHTFVVNDEKEEYKNELRAAYEREKLHFEELSSARKLAYTDTLTGVKTKLAFVELEERIDSQIMEQRASEFAIAIFDLNGLKTVNDKAGHESGDRYLKNACRNICDHFKHSPVFRIGGDEFVAYLEGENYRARGELITDFNRLMDYPVSTDQAIIAAGISDYIPGVDTSLNDVFKRADKKMYERKRELKKTKKFFSD